MEVIIVWKNLLGLGCAAILAEIEAERKAEEKRRKEEEERIRIENEVSRQVDLKLGRIGYKRCSTLDGTYDFLRRK